MKVISNDTLTVLFQDVEGGECFQDKEGAYYIKMEGYYQEFVGMGFKVNALNLENGLCAYFRDQSEVLALPDAVLNTQQTFATFNHER